MTVEGVAGGLQVLPPARDEKHCPTLYGKACFVMKDDTRIMPVDVLGTSKPSAAEILPKDGDRIRITGLVKVLNWHKSKFFIA
ncbi:MAG: hypothetical protein IPP12_13815 [Nitrospira sp.]|nr:hypothetical protein [Nitrospira sp.]